MLIVACSEPKVPGKVAAARKYNTRQHRTAVEGWSTLWGQKHGLFILSAEFGLVPGQRQLPDYDTKMTPAIAADHVPQIRAIIEAVGDPLIYVYGGKTYRDAVKAAAPEGYTVVELVGANRGCGDHFSALQEFLS